MMKKFKQGEIVKSGDNTYVIVTGKGSRSAGYPCFAGTVIKENEHPIADYPLGMHSTSWTKDAFVKANKTIVIRKNNEA